MYTAFKDIKQSLPGESEVLGNQAPSVKVYLYPIKHDNSQLQLPKLQNPLLILQKIITMEVLKKYLVSKFPEEKLLANQIVLLYNNMVIPDHYKLDDVEKIYKITPDKKTVIHYHKKENSNNI